MKDFFESTMFSGIFLTLITYGIGLALKKKFKLAIFNPLLISEVLSIVFVAYFKVDIKKYNDSTKILTYLLTPATICLAIPLYEQFQKLKDNWVAVLGGIFAGTVASLSLIFGSALIFKLNHDEYTSLLPKSITTAIGIVLSEQYSGIVGITIGAIVITGITGNVFCEPLLKLCHITHPVAKGVAIGTASHALGTSKALQIGEIEGAMSGLSIAVCGLLTVVLMSFFVQFA